MHYFNKVFPISVCLSFGPSAMDDLDFLLDLLTYTCPVTGRKRCAVSAGLDAPATVKRPVPSEHDA